MNAVISIDRLSKHFGDVCALDNLTLEIPSGGLYGVLGPNGAGKSTLFRILLGLVHPTQGRGQMMGYPLGHSPTLRRVGAMIEIPRYPPYLSAIEALQWLARAHGTADSTDFAYWIDRVGLTDAAERKLKGFSVGMMQRLGIAAALMSHPELVILDEPTSGMDPPGAQDIRNLLQTLAEEEGVTFVVASHQLQEVQRLCDRVAILNHGKLAAEGKVSELTTGSEYLLLKGSPLAAIQSIVGDAGQITGDAIHINILQRDIPGLISHLVSEGIAIMEVRWVGADLEAVFMHELAAAQANDSPSIIPTPEPELENAL